MLAFVLASVLLALCHSRVHAGLACGLCAAALVLFLHWCMLAGYSLRAPGVDFVTAAFFLSLTRLALALWHILGNSGLC